MAIAAAFPDIPNPPEAAVVVGTNAKFNDYQCNSSMQLAQFLKPIYVAKGAKPPPPRDIALKIIENMPPTPLIERVNTSGPGFINIFLSKAYPEKILNSFLLNGIQPPKHPKKRVIVDFSSPNIGKNLKRVIEDSELLEILILSFFFSCSQANARWSLAFDNHWWVDLSTVGILRSWCATFESRRRLGHTVR